MESLKNYRNIYSPFEIIVTVSRCKDGCKQKNQPAESPAYPIQVIFSSKNEVFQYFLFNISLKINAFLKFVVSCNSLPYSFAKLGLICCS